MPWSTLQNRSGRFRVKIPPPAGFDLRRLACLAVQDAPGPASMTKRSLGDLALLWQVGTILEHSYQ